jgi:trans-aconitate 2-methyltransferase
MSDWSPTTYLKFEDERTRPARDLLAQVHIGQAGRIVDVGCGPGNSTELLAARFPGADILGIDNSPAMLTAAGQRLPGRRFEIADANTWTPDPDVDLVYANATYQWVGGHLEQLRRVLAALRPGAILAVQMPDNLAEPTHRMMSAVAEAGPWRERLARVARDPLPPPRTYHEALAPFAGRIDLWHTIYNHVLADAPAIVEFVRATGLRPYLDPLSDPERRAFLERYTARIAEAYPALADGKVMLRFPRFFIVAQR